LGSEDQDRRVACLAQFYHEYVENQDSAGFIRLVSTRYTRGTLERLAEVGDRETRRAAVLALGYVGDYGCNTTLGKALHDSDRGVRTLAENGLRGVWCRAGSSDERQQLAITIRSNTSQHYREAAVQAGRLIERAPWFAEAWNQRAIAHFGLGRYAESIYDCRQALELNPYHFGAAAGMGQCHLLLGNRTTALECFRRALRLNPELEGVRASVTYLERVLKKKS